MTTTCCSLSKSRLVLSVFRCISSCRAKVCLCVCVCECVSCSLSLSKGLRKGFPLPHPCSGAPRIGDRELSFLRQGCGLGIAPPPHPRGSLSRSLSLSLSLSLFASLSIHPSIHPSVRPSIHRSIHLPVNVHIYIYVQVHIHTCTYVHTLYIHVPRGGCVGVYQSIHE